MLTLNVDAATDAAIDAFAAVLWLFAMELVALIVLLFRLLLFMCDKLKFRSLFKITIELLALL